MKKVEIYSVSGGDTTDSLILVCRYDMEMEDQKKLNKMVYKLY